MYVDSSLNTQLLKWHLSCLYQEWSRFRHTSFLCVHPNLSILTHRKWNVSFIPPSSFYARKHSFLFLSLFHEGPAYPNPLQYHLQSSHLIRFRKHVSSLLTVCSNLAWENDRLLSQEKHHLLSLSHSSKTEQITTVSTPYNILFLLHMALTGKSRYYLTRNVKDVHTTITKDIKMLGWTLPFARKREKHRLQIISI